MSNLEKTSKDFYKTTKNSSNRLIFWMMTWHLGFVKESHLQILLKKALPHQVICNQKYYGNIKKYDKMNNWIELNSKGYWTHINIHFYFEFEEDALAFKLRWS